jgi:hypothetical protein
VKVYSHPEPPDSFHTFVQRAHVGPVSGAVIMIVVSLVSLLAAYLFISSYFVRAPLGELRPRQRTRRYALWEAFYRPYAVRRPRHAASQTPRTPPSTPGHH